MIKSGVKQGHHSLEEHLRERLWYGAAVADRIFEIIKTMRRGADRDQVFDIAVSELGEIVVDPETVDPKCLNLRMVDGIPMDDYEYEMYMELVNTDEIDPYAPLWEQLDDIFSPWLDQEMWGKWVEYENKDGQVVREFKNTNYGAPHHYAPLWNLYFRRVEAQQE
jgi:hypothetical protein